MRLTQNRRFAFTLVEMLVVLGIILSLAVMTVLFMPRIQEQQRVRQGADLLQGWLLMAKQRALRDRIPTGIRLQPSGQSPSFVQDLQYVQKPDDYTQGGISLWRANQATFVGADLHGPAGDTVQPGDYLLVRGEGLPSLIASVNSSTTLQVASTIHAYPPQPGTTCSYRIVRQPRPLAGEQPLNLPQDVIIDMSQGKSLNVPQRAPNAWEILFAPSGMVIGQGTGSAPIAFWLRDVSRDPNQPGEQILIAVYPRTGQIAAHPVADASNPYQFLQDGRSSGF
jgi:prepilin-type N-terminal cleavage/methylation domain-containing protein